MTRRRLLRAAGAAAASLPLAGCSQFDFIRDRDNPVRGLLQSVEGLTYRAQRLLIGADALAREFSESEIRQGMRPNGSRDPVTPEYVALREGGFSDYRLAVTGLVERPLSLSLEELRNMPARTQITRHDCVEGWSCIAKWTGVPLAHVLDLAGVRDAARYAVFHCYDALTVSPSGPDFYYESVDLLDARHPQTILAYGCNDEPLRVANGAPVRVRVERQLGYKMAKFVHTIELVQSFAHIEGGRGGYWEDRGYEWYAGI